MTFQQSSESSVDMEITLYQRSTSKTRKRQRHHESVDESAASLPIKGDTMPEKVLSLVIKRVSNRVYFVFTETAGIKTRKAYLGEKIYNKSFFCRHIQKRLSRRNYIS